MIHENSRNSFAQNTSMVNRINKVDLWLHCVGYNNLLSRFNIVVFNDIFFFRQRFSHFRHKRRFFARPPLFSTFCFPTEQALLSILILTNRAEIQPLNHSRDQSWTVWMYNSPGECRESGQ
jgi:hypothetical protein